MDTQAMRGSRGIQASINVTPLVDVCLVLLIIFMVVTPMINDGVSVDVPETAKPAKLRDDRAARTVSVRTDGRVFLNDQEVAPGDLGARLRQTPDGESAIIVRGDRALPFAAVRSVLQQINQAGVTRVALVTLQRGGSASR
ncbi:MAG TPA: biopolymer transporter ExbD [Thermoanaerobaculaceae bacterium]|nr:biopolymer transporter ExbD [Thermoanaerobaculaceae bacterium]